MRGTHAQPAQPAAAEPPDADEMETGFLRRGDGMLPVVGLGASAGGIAALQNFFAAMPTDSGLAFVVVLHLSPHHESILAEMFQRSTAMPVVAATDGVTLERNSVYVIPPGKFLASANGHLSLTDTDEPRGKRVAVDYFFRTLAESHGAQSLAIVLSGAGGDGALGLKRIKELGGLTIAQDPDEAEHPEMPRSAIATGVVDWVLGVKEMPAKLLAYVKQREELNLPGEDGPHPAEKVALSPDEHEAALRDVLAFLHTRTGRDFSCYKRATILRRIARRMQVNGLSDLPGYLVYLRTHAGEANALLQDLLISVTNFFRDAASFAALELTIPDLFTGKDSGDTVRVWVPGCATGEEAYSIAILLSEHAATLVGPPQLQVFATDLDEEVIREAREGLYPETIAADVSEERLRHFFISEQGGYRVRRAVRELVLFAPHDLLKDSPFSRLDLVSCRNLLIYLKREAQCRAFDIFHFALRPGGRLFLGTSEAVDDGSPLFAVLDKKQRLYVQRPGPQRLIAVPPGPGTLARALALQERTQERPAVPSPVTVHNVQMGLGQGVPLDSGLPPAELHYRLIERFSPPSILVNSAHEIVHLSESAGRFLQFTGGEPSRNLLRTVHPMLRVELRAALYAAAQTHTAATAFRVPVELGEVQLLVDILVTPAGDLAPNFLLVVFKENPASGTAHVAMQGNADADQAALHLERELVATKAHLRDTIEESEASTEELKASNEELQAMNEELRSATEELETSREELQSINEELTTVNEELKTNVDQLARSNNDLQNLMAATDIATVFLDRDLCIQRFTPSAKALFHFISTDLGRPLSDLSRQLDYPEIVADAEHALAHLQPAQREVSAGERWYLARILPYRTTDDHIAGVVLTFLDITAHKESESALRASEAQFRALAESIQQLAWMANAEGDIFWFNRRWYDYTGTTLEQMKGWGWQSVHHPVALPDVLTRWRASIASGQPFDMVFPLKGVNGLFRAFLTRIEPVKDGRGRVVQWFGTNTDISEVKRAEDLLRASEARFRAGIEAVSNIVWTNDAHGMMTGDQASWGNFTGQDRESYQGYGWSRAVHPDDAQPTIDAWNEAVAQKRIFVFEHRVRRSDGQWRHCSIRAVPVLDDRGEISEWVGVHTDITERKQAEEKVRESEQRFRLVADAAPVLIWLSGTDKLCYWFNQPWLDFTGRSMDQEVGNGWAEGVHPDDVGRCLQTYLAAFDARTQFSMECRLRRHDGEFRWLIYNGVPRYKAGGEFDGYIGSCLDVTDYKNAEAGLREADRRKDEFLATLAHELRNPLAPIRNGLQVIRLAGAKGTVEQARVMMDRQLTQMVRLVDDLLDVSRVTSGKLELRRVRIELRSVIDSAVETSRSVIEQAGVELVVVVPEESIVLDGDATRLAQVVANLLNNSAKYTRRGGHIRLEVKREDMTAVLSVKDDGIGIPTAMLGRVFEMFIQVDRTLEKTTGGLGIGLSLVKGLVDMHGGSIEARSEGEGLGSEFVVRLPVLKLGTAVQAADDGSQGHLVSSYARRILVVDDNEDSADSLAKILEMLGNEVRKAPDGEAGIEAAAVFRPDVVLMDIGMPRLNGYDACRQIREQQWGRDMVLVALTGWGQDDDRQQSADAGFDYHLVKPVELSALSTLLAELKPPVA